jgi:HemK-related putative methylase
MSSTDTFLNWWKERNSRPGFYGTATVNDITVIVHKGVYSPDPSCTHASLMLTHVLSNLEDKNVLDIGTGTGFLAIYAAKKGAKKVTAVDIQPEAIENALENVATFGLSNTIEIFTSDVFENVTGKYDVIIANLPIMDPEWTELNRIAVETNSRFFAELESHLEPQGRAYICCSSWADVTAIESMIQNSKLVCTTHAEEARQAIWYAYELKRPSLDN